MLSKKCTKCFKEQTLDLFYKRKNAKDGLGSWCKNCNKEYRQQNISTIKKQRQLNYLSNKNYHIEKAKRYYNNNKEKVLKRCKEWYYNNKEFDIQRKREWYLKNPEKGRLNARKGSRKRRAIKRNITENYNSETMTKVLFDNRCFKCLSNTNLEIDHHYPLSKGFKLAEDNAVLLCKSCNTSKGNKMPEEFYTISELQKLEYILAFFARTIETKPVNT